MNRWESPATPLADWSRLDALVERCQRFVLTTHVNPDGDGLGSEVALALYLESLGKQVVILNDGNLPPNYTYLARSHAIESFDEARAREIFAAAEVLIVLDTCARPRLGRVGSYLEQPGLHVVVIDHHLGEAKFATLSIVVPEACAAGELVYDFIRRRPESWTRPMAEALYTSLVTDTGSFRFANTDPPAHAMAAHLLELGVQPEPLLALIHQHRHADRLRFLGAVLTRLQVTPDGAIAWLEADRDTMTRFDVNGTDTEGLVDFPRAIPGVEAVALLTETEAGRIKLSLRSTGRVDVDSVARGFGGGGHRAAAGALLRGPLEAARERVLEALAGAVARVRGTGAPAAEQEARAASSGSE